MKLNILTSPKGTKVVTASGLHAALELADHQYVRNITKWLSDVYAFDDDVRKPIEMKDFARRVMKVSKLQDYYMAGGFYESRLEAESKNHAKKAVDLGKNVMLDQERCVLCTRCTRFTDEIITPLNI